MRKGRRDICVPLHEPFRPQNRTERLRIADHPLNQLHNDRLTIEGIVRMKIFDNIDKVLQVLITVMTMVLVTVSFASVFSRFVLQHSLVWADEFMRYLFIWVVFFAGSILAINKAHITVDLTSLFIPKKYQTLAYRTGYGIVLVFLSILFGYSIKMVILSVDRLSPSMELPMAYVYLCLPIGIGLMIIAYVRLMVRDWNGIPVGGEY